MVPRLAGSDGILFDDPLTLAVDEGADDINTRIGTNVDPDGPTTAGADGIPGNADDTGTLTALDNPNPDRRVVDPDGDPSNGNQGTSPFYVLRRNTEGGGRQSDIRFQNYRTVLGIRGELSPGWDYDLYGAYGHNQFALVQRNDFSLSRLTKALDVVDADPGPGVTPACRSFVASTDLNCVPYDIFTVGGVTQAALTYLQVPELIQAEIVQQVVAGSVTGDTGFALPTAELSIQASFGLEYRQDQLTSDVDATITSGDAAGSGVTNPLSGTGLCFRAVWGGEGSDRRGCGVC